MNFSRLSSLVVTKATPPLTTNEEVAAAAINLLDVDRGFLPNRMTTAQRNAIASPPASLLIFNTDTGLYEFFTGTVWGPVNATARNCIINAGMEIDQAHEGASVSYANSTNYVTDQWFLTGTSSATGITAQQSTDAPPGFSNSELITIGTAGGSVPASNLLLFCQRFSGDQTGNFAFGTPQAQSVATSFWVKSNQTGIFPYHMRHNYSGGSSTFIVPFNLTQANTWTFMSAVIPGDPAHGTTVDAANDITIGFGLTSGTNDMDTPNQWNTNTHHTVAGMWQLELITGATFQVTGVSVAQGPSIPIFSRRDAVLEQANCQRYYSKSYDPGVVPGTGSTLGGAEQMVAGGTTGIMPIRTKVTGAKTGTFTVYSPVSGTSGQVADITGSADVAATVINPGLNGAAISFTATDGHQYAAQWVRNAQL